MKKLLLVDADPLSLCVLDVSLRKAGYQVTTAADGVDALEKVDSIAPHLVLTDTRLPKLDGYGLVRTLRERPEASDTPVVFLGGQESLEDRRRAHELGVEDYLAKPVFLAELIARINLVFARRTREHVAGGHSSKFARNRFVGSTQDFALVDLLRNFEVTRRTGVIHLRNGLQEAHVYFREGKAIDGELGPLRGEEAIFRALMWTEASFDIELKPVPNEDVIPGATSAIVQRGMQRVDEWVRLCDQVQSLAALLDIHPPELLERLSRLTAIPDSLHGLLRLNPPPDVRAALPAMAAAQPPIHPSPAVPIASVASATSERSGVAAPVAGVSAPAAPRPAPATSPGSAASAEAAAPTVAPSVSTVAAPGASAPPVSSGRPATHPPALVEESIAPSPARVVAAAPVRPSVQPAATSTRRSDAPWSREVAPAHDPASDADAIAAGVPRAIGTTTKRVVGTSVAVAAVLLVVVGLNSVRDRQLREAEAARNTGGLSAVGAAAAVVPAVPPSAPSAPSNVRPDPEPQPPPAAARTPEPPAVVSAPVAAEPAQKTQPQVPAPPMLPRSGFDTAGTSAVGAGPALAGIAPPERRVRETSLDTKLAGTGQMPLVSDAERALLKGQTERALTLAHQAVTENEADADAWLTLAAAQKASGDFAGARESYRSCIGHAHTVGLDHCRVLARSEQ